MRGGHQPYSPDQGLENVAIIGGLLIISYNTPEWLLAKA